MSTAPFFVYILLCNNGSYYTGYTTNLSRRYQEHVLGTGKCKYTRSFKPLHIAQSWQINADKSLAMKTEKFIKKMSKQEKEQLILNPECLAQLFTQATGNLSSILPQGFFIQD
jgi:putative endonuclease